METANKHSPPYATYSSLMNFVSQFKEKGLPPRIDKSIFGNASGSLIYSVLASLRSLGLVDEGGRPTALLKRLVSADSDAEKARAVKDALRIGFPSLWDGSIDVSTATAGQFDEHIRERYDVKGSTIDKIAAFFIAAANDTEIPVSSFIKARKAVAPSGAGKKTAKSKRSKDSDESTPEASVDKVAQKPNLSTSIAKPLEYQLIDLMSEPDIEDEVKGSIWRLVQYLMDRKRRQVSDEAEEI